MNRMASAVVGFVIGIAFLLVFQVAMGLTPKHYSDVTYQALGKPDGLVYPDELRKFLNPCLQGGQLPQECVKYIKDGVVTQPPIKVVLDTTH